MHYWNPGHHLSFEMKAGGPVLKYWTTVSARGKKLSSPLCLGAARVYHKSPAYWYMKACNLAVCNRLYIDDFPVKVCIVVFVLAILNQICVAKYNLYTTQFWLNNLALGHWVCVKIVYPKTSCTSATSLWNCPKLVFILNTIFSGSPTIIYCWPKYLKYMFGSAPAH